MVKPLRAERGKDGARRRASPTDCTPALSPMGRGSLPRLSVDLRLGDSVDQAQDNRKQRGQEPQPPPHRPVRALDHLVPAEPAEAIEWARDSATPRALVQLQAAVRTPDFL